MGATGLKMAGLGPENEEVATSLFWTGRHKGQAGVAEAPLPSPRNPAKNIGEAKALKGKKAHSVPQVWSPYTLGLEVCVWLLLGLQRMGRGVCQPRAAEEWQRAQNQNPGQKVGKEQFQRTETGWDGGVKTGN